MIFSILILLHLRPLSTSTIIPTMSNNDDSIRQKSIQFLFDSIQASNTTANEANRLAVDLESSIFESHDSQTHNPYRQDVRTKGLALKQNVQLAQNLIAGQVSPQQVAAMDDEVSRKDMERVRDSEMIDEKEHRSVRR